MAFSVMPAAEPTWLVNNAGFDRMAFRSSNLVTTYIPVWGSFQIGASSRSLS